MKYSYLFYEPIRQLDDLARRMETLASLGFDGIELSAFHPLPYAIDEVARLAERSGMPVVSMLTGWSYPNEGLCLSSPIEAVRERAVERLGDYVEQAAALGSLLVVGLMQGLRSDEPVEDRANDRIADCLQRLAPKAEAQGVSVVLEPVNHLQVGFNNTVAQAAAMANRVGSPAIGYMLDTFHLNIEERSVLEAVRLHGLAARHVHLCETTGGPFGSGHLDFPGVLSGLRRAGYDRWVSLKVYRGPGWAEAARDSAGFLRREGLWNHGSDNPEGR